MALSGTLETFCVPDVLRLLSSTRKSGVLVLHGDRGTGEVWLEGGAVTAARTSRSASADVHGVVFDLLRFVDGSFEFDPTRTEPDSGLTAGDPADVEEVLEQAEALLAQWSAIEAVVPSLGVWARLAPEITGDVTVNPATWSVLARIGTGCRGSWLADDLGFGEFETCSQLRDLVEQGLVELDPEREIDPDVADDARPEEPVEADVVPPVSVAPAGPAPSSFQDFDDDAKEAARTLPAFEPPSFATSVLGGDDPAHDPAQDHDAESDLDLDLDDDAGAHLRPSVDDPATVDDEAPSAEPDATTVRWADAVDDAWDVEDPEPETPPAVEPVAEVDGDGPVADETSADEPSAEEPHEEPVDDLSGLANLSPKAAAAIEATAGVSETGPARDDAPVPVAPETAPTGARTDPLSAAADALRGGTLGARAAASRVGRRDPGATEPAPPAATDVPATPADDPRDATDDTTGDETGDEGRGIDQGILLRFLSSTK